MGSDIMGSQDSRLWAVGLVLRLQKALPASKGIREHVAGSR